MIFIKILTLHPPWLSSRLGPPLSNFFIRFLFRFTKHPFDQPCIPHSHDNLKLSNQNTLLPHLESSTIYSPISLIHSSLAPQNPITLTPSTYTNSWRTHINSSHPPRTQSRLASVSIARNPRFRSQSVGGRQRRPQQRWRRLDACSPAIQRKPRRSPLTPGCWRG